MEIRLRNCRIIIGMRSMVSILLGFAYTKMEMDVERRDPKNIQTVFSRGKVPGFEFVGCIFFWDIRVLKFFSEQEIHDIRIIG